jgi:glycosyltransferase involved in cell wall biosynthesis
VTLQDAKARLPGRLMLLGVEPKSLLNFRRPLIEAARAAGYDVAVASLAPSAAQRRALAELGAAVHVSPFARAGMNPLKDLSTLAALVGLFRRVKPEGVVAYTAKPVIYGLLAAWLAGIPHRVALITGLGYSFVPGPERKRRIAKAVAVRLYRLALPRATAILFQNPDDRQTFADLGLLPRGVPVGVVNGSGVDLAQFALAAMPKDPVFVMVARLLTDKGVREYAEAAARLRAAVPGARTVLVGGLDPSPNSLSESELQAYVAGGMDYRGEVDDVRPILAEASVVVLPSYREGTPRSVLEGMAMGRAIITSDAPGCRETVVPGANGVLVPVRNAAALADAMITLARDPATVRAMGQASHQLAREKYEAGLVARETLRLAGLLPGGGT